MIRLFMEEIPDCAGNFQLSTLHKFECKKPDKECLLLPTATNPFPPIERLFGTVDEIKDFTAGKAAVESVIGFMPGLLKFNEGPREVDQM